MRKCHGRKEREAQGEVGEEVCLRRAQDRPREAKEEGRENHQGPVHDDGSGGRGCNDKRILGDEKKEIVRQRKMELQNLIANGGAGFGGSFAFGNVGGGDFNMSGGGFGMGGCEVLVP